MCDEVRDDKSFSNLSGLYYIQRAYTAVQIIAVYLIYFPVLKGWFPKEWSCVSGKLEALLILLLKCSLYLVSKLLVVNPM